MRRGKVRWGAIANAVLGTVSGLIAIASSQEAAPLIPPAWAGAVSIATLVNATFIKPALRTEEERRRPPSR